MTNRRPPIHESMPNRYVYDWCMGRTNIEIDDAVLEAVMRRYRLRTKREAVDLALRWLAGQPMSRDEALAMRGARAIGEPPDDRGPRSDA